MAVQPIPEGFNTVTPYLILEDAAGFIDYAKAAFDAVEMYRMDHGDGTVMHAQIRVGDSILMMGGASSEYPPIPGSFYMYVDNVDERFAHAVAAGGEVLRGPTTEFYGDRVAGIKDPYGNTWWISTHVEDVSEEELAERAKQFKQ